MLVKNNLKSNRMFVKPSQQKATGIGFFIRLFSTKSVCFTVLLIFCFLSLMATVSQISFQTHLIRVQHSVSQLSTNRNSLPPKTKTSFVTTNEKDLHLKSMNTSNIKQQSLLTLKKQKLRRKVVQQNITNKVQKESENNFSKNGSTQVTQRSNSTQNKNLAAKKDLNTKVRSSKNALERRNTLPNNEPVNMPRPRSPKSKPDYFNTAIDNKHKQKENFGENMGPQQLEQPASNAKIDPVRQSFLKNVSRYVATIKRRRRLLNYYKKPVSMLPNQSKGVVILTNYRSGSTFLGQLFNQHPEAFYTFEPLYPFTGGCGNQGLEMAQVIHRILKCDFPSQLDVYGQVRGPMRKDGEDIKCLTDDFCFRKKTKELCEKDLCAFGNQPSCDKCGPVHMPRVMNACRAKQMSVVKVIRLCDIKHLKPVLDDPSMDVKIVHLVRDPRGLESSRSKIRKISSIKKNAEGTCYRLLHNSLDGLANTSDTKWLKGRYIRVRYEDLSLAPLSMAQKIYNFTGLKFMPHLKKWIENNTKASPQEKVRPYSTKRDSAATMQAWRRHLSFKDVRDIQEVCETAMNFLGYKSVANQSELDNMKIQLLS